MVIDTSMRYSSHCARDGTKLAFQTSLPLNNASAADTCIILMHGFSGSSEYFCRNFTPLAARGVWVVAPDMRGHGESDKPWGGYHVARLAADLCSLVAHLRRAAPNAKFVPVGCSIGAAVLWTYVELFGCDDFAGFVFVDQAPLQNRSRFDSWDERFAHTGCYDEETTKAAQEFWISHSKDAHVDLVNGCLGYRAKPDALDKVSGEQRQRDEEFFTSISAKCNQVWLARLLADHTSYDHREAIESISVPTLVMAGRRSGCFSLEGMLETVRRVERHRPGLARASVYESGHWLFYEEPDRFNEEIWEFAMECTERSPE
ncbi:AB hydrolase superfamily protein YdjP [Colletotrichum spinosum]|uniref:AB hydrolase superfamily protein YdjP n=1 Tax=Colletotrichum spinosum TaxID=1347390 RepID=A0A4R8QL39_9PEZI|nr:AB hydrolase superfamily protein YdjP [Colletotrichum spinosum]